MERLGQMQHLAAEPRVAAAGFVEPARPVERRLERVLDGDRTAVDEEQVRQRRVAEDPCERVDEPGHRHGVDVGVAGLVDGHRGELVEERAVADEVGMVHAQGGGREEPEHVEVGGAVALVDQAQPR